MDDADDKQAAHKYWVNETHTKPEAVALGKRLNMLFPMGDEYDIKAGLMYPVRRLIVAGEDTEANFAILFGPHWEKQIPSIHREIRIEVLLCPAPKTAGHFLASFMDEGCPVWRPRGPSVEEEDMLKRVYKVSKAIEQAMAMAQEE